MDFSSESCFLAWPYHGPLWFESSLSRRFTMAIYPPMAFGISIIAFTLQLVREKDAVFQLASTSCRKTLPPFIAYYSWIMLVAKSTCTKMSANRTRRWRANMLRWPRNLQNLMWVCRSWNSIHEQIWQVLICILKCHGALWNLQGLTVRSFWLGTIMAGIHDWRNWIRTTRQ